MSRLRLLNSFRARLLLIFLLILLSTLALQFFFTLWAQRDKQLLLSEQEKALGLALTLGFKSLRVDKEIVLDDIIKEFPPTESGYPFLTLLPEGCGPACPEDKSRPGRIRNILILDAQNKVFDSTNFYEIARKKVYDAKGDLLLYRDGSPQLIDGLLTKPFANAALAQAVHRLITEPRRPPPPGRAPGG